MNEILINKMTKQKIVMEYLLLDIAMKYIYYVA